MVKTYPVSKRELDKGQQIEQREHPTLSPRMARTVARNHLQRHASYYMVEPMMERIMDNRDATAAKMQRKLPKRRVMTGREKPGGMGGMGGLLL